MSADRVSAVGLLLIECLLIECPLIKCPLIHCLLIECGAVHFLCSVALIGYGVVVVGLWFGSVSVQCNVVQ